MFMSSSASSTAAPTAVGPEDDAPMAREVNLNGHDQSRGDDGWRPARRLVIVLLGATGDLAERKLLPRSHPAIGERTLPRRSHSGSSVRATSRHYFPLRDGVIRDTIPIELQIHSRLSTDLDVTILWCQS